MDAPKIAAASTLMAMTALAMGCRTSAVANASASTEPVLVELFTSEGCSSCPAAEEALAALNHSGVEGVPVVLLGLHVDYWDNLGWKDKFASPALTSRQRSYAAALGHGGLYTPEAVVDGQGDFVGSDLDAAREQVRRAAGRSKALVVITRGADGGTPLPTALGELSLVVRVSRLPAPTSGDTFEVVTAVTEEGIFDEVARGENAGRRLALAPVARSIDVAGPVREGGIVPVTIHLPNTSKPHSLRVVAFVEERGSRRVLGVAAVPLERL
jgi:hypothetical protein